MLRNGGSTVSEQTRTKGGRATKDEGTQDKNREEKEKDSGRRRMKKAEVYFQEEEHEEKLLSKREGVDEGKDLKEERD